MKCKSYKTKNGIGEKKERKFLVIIYISVEGKKEMKMKKKAALFDCSPIFKQPQITLDSINPTVCPIITSTS
jgi:hypothetical protein